MEKTLKKSSKCHTLILQGHVQSSVLCKVKHVMTLFARQGHCYEVILPDVIASIWCIVQNILTSPWRTGHCKNPFSGNQEGLLPLRCFLLPRDSQCKDIQIWWARNPKLNSDLSSLSANISCDWSRCWTCGYYVVFIQVESELVEAWDSLEKAR